MLEELCHPDAPHKFFDRWLAQTPANFSICIRFRNDCHISASRIDAIRQKFSQLQIELTHFHEDPWPFGAETSKRVVKFIPRGIWVTNSLAKLHAQCPNIKSFETNEAMLLINPYFFLCMVECLSLKVMPHTELNYAIKETTQLKSLTATLTIPSRKELITYPPSLERLELRNATYHDMRQALRTLPLLHELGISGESFVSSAFFDADEVVPISQNLRIFRCWAKSISDEFVSLITTHMPRLDELEIAHTEVLQLQPLSLATIGNLSQLRCLKLQWNSDTKKAELESLFRSLEKLETLHLRRCRVDADLQLPPLLKEVNLSGTNMTFEGLKQFLNSAQSLVELTVTLPNDQFEMLKKAYPKVQFKRAN